MGFCLLQRHPSIEPLLRLRTPERIQIYNNFLPQGLFPHSVFPVPGSGFVGELYLSSPPAPSGFLNLLTPSSARYLPTLFHAGSAYGIRPSEPCSSRAAVRRLQRHSPHDISFARSPQHIQSMSQNKKPESLFTAPKLCVTKLAKHHPPSGFCSTRKSATFG